MTWKKRSYSNMLKRKHILPIIALSLLAIGGGYYSFSQLKYQPKINPNPKYFITVKGHVSPRLKDKITLEWISEFATTNPKCDKTVNYLEGVDVPRISKKNYSIDSRTVYQKQIPLNYYFPGYCAWMLKDIRYEIKTKNTLLGTAVISFFGESKLKGSYNVHDIIACNHQTCQHVGKPYLNTNHILSTHSNYFFQLNITNSKVIRNQNA